MVRRFHFVGTSLVLALLSVAPLGAQITTGTVTGTVKDPQGGVIPGATGVLLDRPEALAGAPKVLSEAGVVDRAELVAGNFFAGVPEGDVHLLSSQDFLLVEREMQRIAESRRSRAERLPHALAPSGGV